MTYALFPVEYPLTHSLLVASVAVVMFYASMYVLMKVEILSKPPDPLDVQGYDMSISASMSRLRVTFVYLFIGRLLRFIKMVGVDTEEAKESARQGASAAVTAVSGVGGGIRKKVQSICVYVVQHCTGLVPRKGKFI